MVMFRASFHDEGTAYDALSYRWEGPADHHYISVNGTRVPVMANLFYALKEMRTMFGAKEIPILRNLWVDSICIDQASVEERTKQVSLMGEIYSRASTVRVWIGQPQSIDVRAAFDLINDSLQIDRTADYWKNIVKWQSTKVIVSNGAGVKALTELLNRPYWNRMWVFQEVVLAKKAVVHCGTHAIPWEHFKQFDEVLGNRGAWKDNTAHVPHQDILDLRKALFGTAHLFVSRAQAAHTRNVLQPTRHLQCQDPRDKLYALLGVCGALAGIVRPDYALSARQVYVAFSKSRIRADGDLSSLVTAGLWTPAHGDDIGLPSWVPDLRSMEGVDMRYISGTTLGRFNAAEPDNSEVRFLDEGSSCILETQALLVDIVLVCQDLERTRNEGWRRLVDKFCSSEDAALSLPKLRSFFRVMVFEDASFFGQSQDGAIDMEIARGMWKGIAEEVMDQGLGDDQYGKGSSSAVRQRDHVKMIQKRALTGLILGFWEELKRHFSHQLERLMEFLDIFKDVGLDLQDHLLRQDGPDPDDMHLHWMEFLARTDETTDKGDSAIFSTRHDRIGTGPRNILPGDHVALVRGCRVPLLLRPRGRYYRLVGPCYVSGLMQGEAFSGGTERDGPVSEQVQII